MFGELRRHWSRKRVSAHVDGLLNALQKKLKLNANTGKAQNSSMAIQFHKRNPDPMVVGGRDLRQDLANSLGLQLPAANGGSRRGSAQGSRRGSTMSVQARSPSKSSMLERTQPTP